MRTAGLLAVLLAVGLAAGQPPAAKSPAPADAGPTVKLLYGNDAAVRPAGEKELTKAVAVPVELFAVEAPDGAARKALTVAVSGPGFLTAAPAGAVGGDKRLKRHNAHDVLTRQGAVKELTKDTKKWGVEVFRDLGTNRLLYVTEAGAVASAAVPAALTADKGLTRLHGLALKVRAPGVIGFDKAKPIGVEVLRDDNAGVLVFLSETGAVAVGPAPAGAAGKGEPTAAYGLDLLVRKADEGNFDKTTKKVGVEAYLDPQSNALVYVTEAGGVAVAPNPGKLADATGVAWLGGVNVKVRKAGGSTFDGAARYGVELFRDNRTGNLLLVSETGAIAVLPK